MIYRAQQTFWLLFSSPYFLGCDFTWVLLAVWKIKKSKEGNLCTFENRWQIKLNDENIVIVAILFYCC